jgi:hypothetical protein
LNDSAVLFNSSESVVAAITPKPKTNLVPATTTDKLLNAGRNLIM